MASDYLTKKWKRLFTLFDINKDSVINEDDAAMFGQNVIEINKMNETAAEELKTDIKEFYHGLFLRGTTETNEEQFINTLTEELTKSEEEFFQNTRKHFAMFVSTADVNNDGIISCKELRNVLKACGIMTFHRKHYDAYPRVVLPQHDISNDVHPNNDDVLTHSRPTVKGKRKVSISTKNGQNDVTNDLKSGTKQDRNIGSGMKRETSKISNGDIKKETSKNTSSDADNKFEISKSSQPESKHETSTHGTVDEKKETPVNGNGDRNGSRMSQTGGAGVKRASSKIGHLKTKPGLSKKDSDEIKEGEAKIGPVEDNHVISNNRKDEVNGNSSQADKENITKKQAETKNVQICEKEVVSDTNGGKCDVNVNHVNKSTSTVGDEETDGIKSELFLESWVAFCCNNDGRDMCVLEKARLYGFRMIQSMDVEPAEL